MKIAIIGTRGIPNNYGGFEQFAEHFSVFMAGKGHSVYVYCPHNHPYKSTVFYNVQLVKCYDPEYSIGTAGQFIYDYNCFQHSKRLNPDVILNLGYTSSAIFMPLFGKRIPVVTNMDGLEWKRSKYNFITQRFIKFSERLAARYSNLLIADSVGIGNYLKHEYGKEAVYIAYGAQVLNYTPDIGNLEKIALRPRMYNMLIARFEPENNIEMILDGAVASGVKEDFILIGNHKNKFGKHLKLKFGNYPQIRFLGPLYDVAMLDSLRYYCRCYFHGHSVGGTNPSLLEAMASSAFIAAHDNEFNRDVVGSNALYFKEKSDVAEIIRNPVQEETRRQFTEGNLNKIKEQYNWEKINSRYENTLSDVIAAK